MVKWEFVYALTRKICELGSKRDTPQLHPVEPLRSYFSQNGELKHHELDYVDGGFARREILARYLLLKVVLDQGPDMVGVDRLVADVVTSLYGQGIKILHRPSDFFENLGFVVDILFDKHEAVKELRAEQWAKENNSNPTRYNLFFAQSTRGVVSTKQVLDYAVHRWGVPLSVPLVLERVRKESNQPLVDHLESFKSAELMAQRLKDDEKYGLGSAIGDKACHLFAKMYVNILNLVKDRTKDLGWTGISYEVPFDSNAGRVLFRTGFLTEWAPLSDYEDWDVIQKGKGKSGTDYIRVTNIRGNKTQKIPLNSQTFSDYIDVVVNHLKMARNPRSAEVQRIPNVLLYQLMKNGYNYSMADFDDGLMHIGTKFCFNHRNPDCQHCPVKDLCRAYNEDRALITNYTT